MKKIIALLLVLILSVFAFAGCGQGAGQPSGGSGEGELTVLKVGASSTPHAQILAAVKDLLAEEGIDLQVTEYTDYVIPNTAVESGELDANYFQHLPYLDSFNAEQGTHLVSVAAIHYEPMGIFPGKTATLADLPDGATIAVPNDTTNEGRALNVLQQEGLIKLSENAGLEATPNDIVENPKNIQFYEVEAAAVPRAVGDVDLAVINGNYALEAGFKLEDGLAFEAADSLGAQTYANILVTHEDKASDPAIQALAKALMSDVAKEFMETTYNGAVVPVF